MTTVWLAAMALSSLGMPSVSSPPAGCCQRSHHSLPAIPADAGCGCFCCKTLPAPALALTSIQILPPAPSHPLFVLIAVDRLSPLREAPLALIPSTGPPERLSFAELVLHRSLLSQAPPALA